jgi:riboflavin transporter FmnP
MKNVSRSTNLLVKISLLTAIAIILAFLEFPVLPAFAFLKIDLSDIPALIGAFAFGPLVGAVIEGLKNLLLLLVKGTLTGGIGELANFVVGCSFVCTAALIYSRKKTKTNAIISLFIAILVMAVAGVVSNYLVFVPLYFPGMKTTALIHYMVYGIIPFNLIKGIIISAATLAIYKRVSVLIHAESYNNKKEDTKKIS